MLQDLAQFIKFARFVFINFHSIEAAARQERDKSLLVETFKRFTHRSA